MGNIELVEALVRHGASVQIFNWMGETPREAAQEAGHTHVAEFLDGHEHRVLFHEVASETLALSQQRKPPGDFRKPPWSCPRCNASVNVQNNECFKCGEPKPASTLAAEKEEEPDGVSPYGKHLLYQVRQLQDGISKG
mmetsp:Transcript_84963/g.124300  ORF Transcript_84963/g.124300 Transcript_84963/m.124300 type:complete len:138 (+) Transcript_84963:142-555(+)